MTELRQAIIARIRAHFLPLGVPLDRAEALADDILGLEPTRSMFISGYLASLADDANPYVPEVADQMANEAWEELVAARQSAPPVD